MIALSRRTAPLLLLSLLSAVPAVAQPSSAEVSGDLFNGSVSMGSITTVTPQFTVTNAKSGQAVTGFTVIYDSGSFELRDLPLADLVLDVAFLLNGRRSTFPGNFIGSLRVNTGSGNVSGVTFYTSEVVRLLTPYDNGGIDFTLGAGYPTHADALSFAWRSLSRASTYRFQIDQYRDTTHPSGPGRVGTVAQQTVGSPSFKVSLPASAADEYFEARVTALDVQSFPVGELFVTFTNGFSTGYRFRTAVPAPTITVSGPSLAAVGDIVVLDAAANGCSPDPSGWSWQTQGGQILGAANGSKVDVSWTSPGSKTVTAANVLCPGTSGGLTVDVLAASLTVTGPTVGLVGQDLSFSVSASGCSPGSTGWNWSTSGAQVQGAADRSSITLVWPTPGTKALTVSHPDCGSVQGSASIAVSPPGTLAASFSFAPDPPIVGSPVQFTDETAGGDAWTWSFGDGGSSNQRNPQHTYDRVGIFDVRLDVRDASGARGSSTRSVLVQPGSNVVQLTERRFGGIEGDRRIVVTVERSAPTAVPANVDLRVQPRSARFGSDFGGPAVRTVSWGPNDASIKTIEIPLLEDDAEEPPESFSVLLQNAKGVQLGARSRATVVVSDDDFSAKAEPALSATGENPAVAVSASGLTAAVWQEPSGNGFDIFAKVFDAAGRTLSGPQRLNRRRAGNQTSPDVAWAGDRLVAVWVDEGNSSSLSADGFIVSAARQGGNLVGASFDPSALGQGTEVVLEPGGEVETPQVAADPLGDVVVTWTDGNAPRGLVLDDAMTPSGPSFSLDSQPSTGAVATDKAAGGDFVSVWRSPGQGLRGRVVSQAGKPRGPVFTVSSSLTAAAPALAMSADRTFFVAWEQGASGARVVRARRFDSRGRPLAAAFVVGRGRGGDRYAPTLDTNAAGDLVAVWLVEGAARAAAGTTNAVGAFFTPSGDQIGSDVPVAGPEPGGDPAEPDVSLGDDDGTDVVLTLRDPAGRSGGVIHRRLEPSLAGGACVSDAQTLCLQDGRFRVWAEWQDRTDAQGTAGAEAISSDTGVLWFFADDNVELVVKVLDGCGVNGRYWVFAGGLTDVEVTLRVDDTETGVSRVYSNLSRSAFAPLQDTSAFGGCTAARPTPTETETETTGQAVPFAADAASVACAPGALCLDDGRFEVRVSWRAADGSSGEAEAVPFSNDTGLFWFFDAANIELVVKVLDGCGVNGSHWVFAGGLTNVRTEIRVRDLTTGRERTYVNPQGVPFHPVQDISGLRGCS